MIERRLIFPRCDWTVDIIYLSHAEDADYIADKLWDMGCAEQNLRKARRLLRSGVPNEGLTYTDNAHRHSLIVVGHSTSVGEFLSTVVHEVDHLTDHISRYYGIPYDSEDNSYLIGDIVKSLYEDATNAIFKSFKGFAII